LVRFSYTVVPFDKITDCDIVEPAGNECLCIPRVLFKVRVDTASSNKEHHELVLAGLKDPHSFKKLVWAMKRAQNQANQPFSLEMARALPSIINNTNDNSGEHVTTLLKEIRDELRQNNEALRAMQGPNAAAPLTAPVEAEGHFA
jgi:hypothetical protein